MNDRRAPRWRAPDAWLPWAGALVIAALLLATGGFVSRDPDSRVYSELSTRLAEQPVAAWIAPEWRGVAGARGLFREHPSGILVLPALLARTGYPAAEAGYAVGALYSLIAVVLVGRVAALVIGPIDATALQWAVLLLPVAFVYRVRANQEYPVLVFLLLAVYATERSRHARLWTIVPSIAALAILLIKDVFFVFCPLACALWLLSVRPADGHDRRAWLSVALSMVVVVAGAALYDTWYRRATGESFVAFFVRYRLTPNAGLDRPLGLGRVTMTRLSNVLWYLSRVAWFGFPGSAALAIALRRRAPAGGHVDPLAPAQRARRALVFCLGIAGAYVAVMSLGHNRADRFIFPAYFAVGAAGAGVAIARWAAPARWARRVHALGSAGTAMLWLVLFTLTLASSHQLPRVKFWP